MRSSLMLLLPASATAANCNLAGTCAHPLIASRTRHTVDSHEQCNQTCRLIAATSASSDIRSLSRLQGISTSTIRLTPSLSHLSKMAPTARLHGVVKWPLEPLLTIDLCSASSLPWRPRRRGPTRALPRLQTAHFLPSTRLTPWGSYLGGAGSHTAHVPHLHHHQVHQTLRLQCLTTSCRELQPSVQ